MIKLLKILFLFCLINLGSSVFASDTDSNNTEAENKVILKAEETDSSVKQADSTEKKESSSEEEEEDEDEEEDLGDGDEEPECD